MGESINLFATAIVGKLIVGILFFGTSSKCEETACLNTPVVEAKIEAKTGCVQLSARLTGRQFEGDGGRAKGDNSTLGEQPQARAGLAASFFGPSLLDLSFHGDITLQFELEGARAINRDNSQSSVRVIEHLSII